MTPTYALNLFLWGPSAFPMVGSTWTTGFYAPTGLRDSDLSRVAFLVLFDVDDEDVNSRGGKLGSVAMCLIKKFN